MPPATKTRWKIKSDDCFFFLKVLPRREMFIFSFASAQYLDHLCMVKTAWVFPAIQSHTKAPHRDPFRPASRQLYSTHPDNNSQPGAFILMLLCTRNSPYPEPTQVKVHRTSTLISTHKSCFLISPCLIFSLFLGGHFLFDVTDIMNNNFSASRRAPTRWLAV